MFRTRSRAQSSSDKAVAEEHVALGGRAGQQLQVLLGRVADHGDLRAVADDRRRRWQHVLVDRRRLNQKRGRVAGIVRRVVGVVLLGEALWAAVGAAGPSAPLAVSAAAAALAASASLASSAALTEAASASSSALASASSACSASCSSWC